jgi:NitT/TauT family transport system substrate-binding protein
MMRNSVFGKNEDAMIWEGERKREIEKVGTWKLGPSKLQEGLARGKSRPIEILEKVGFRGLLNLTRFHFQEGRRIMKHPALVKKIGVVMISILLVSFMVGSGDAKDLQPFKVSYLPIIDLLQLYVGWEKGYFEEEGLKVEGQAAPGGAVSQTLVESGSVDMGWTAVVPMSAAYVKGFDFVFIAPGSFVDPSNRRTGALVAKKGSPIKTVKDLAGKKIGVNALNNINHLSILTVADLFGVDIKGLKFVEVSFPMVPGAIREGVIDAANLAEPFLTIAESEGIIQRVYDSMFPPEVMERYLMSAWFAKKSSLEKNKDKIGRFLKANMKATDFINKNPDKLSEIIAKNTKMDINLVRKVVLPKFFTKVYKKDIQIQIDLCAKYGFIPKGFDAKEIVATGLIPLE